MYQIIEENMTTPRYYPRDAYFIGIQTWIVRDEFEHYDHHSTVHHSLRKFVQRRFRKTFSIIWTRAKYFLQKGESDIVYSSEGFFVNAF